MADDHPPSILAGHPVDGQLLASAAAEGAEEGRGSLCADPSRFHIFVLVGNVFSFDRSDRHLLSRWRRIEEEGSNIPVVAERLLEPASEERVDLQIEDLYLEFAEDMTGNRVIAPVSHSGGGHVILPAGRGETAMSIEISLEIEARLSDEARRLGISVEAMLERFVTERAALTHPAQPAPALPVWHLGGAGALHRCDFYDDVR
jgi:hypothetical protein